MASVYDILKQSGSDGKGISLQGIIEQTGLSHRAAQKEISSCVKELTLVKRVEQGKGGRSIVHYGHMDVLPDAERQEIKDNVIPRKWFVLQA